MKLRAKLTASRDGSLVDATDQNLITDAACAHALMWAMEECSAPVHVAVVEMLRQRADEILAGWGFDSGEVE